MAVERAPGGTSLIDVLDRVLDKGIVIDAWVRISLVGIDLITIEARVVVGAADAEGVLAGLHLQPVAAAAPGLSKDDTNDCAASRHLRF